MAFRPIDLKSYEPDPQLIRLIPGDVATKFMALPVSKSGRRLLVAMANPSNIFAIDDIKFITGFEVEPHVATEAAIKKAIDRAYDSAGTMADVMKGMEEELDGRRGGRSSADSEAGIGRSTTRPIVKLRQLADRRRGSQGRVRHPHRALRTDDAGPLPHRRHRCTR